MKAKKVMMMLAAAGLAISPVASNAAASLSIARAAPQMSGVSLLDDDGGRVIIREPHFWVVELIPLPAAATTSADHERIRHPEPHDHRASTDLEHPGRTI